LADSSQTARLARQDIAGSVNAQVFKPLALVAVGIPLLLSCILWIRLGGARPDLDIRSYYMAGYMARTGQSPLLFDAKSQLYYQNLLVSKGDVALPYIHPPYEALLYAPFTLLSYRGAYFAFLVFNLLVLAWTFWIVRPELSNLAAVFSWLPLALFLFFFPVQIALAQGQDSIILLAILVGSRLLLHRDRDVLAGALLAVGLYRFQLVIPIALLFLVWRRWRFVAGFATSSMALLGISLWMVRLSGLKLYYELVLSLSHRVGTDADLLIRVPPQQMPNLRGVISYLSSLPDSWLAALTALASVAVLFFAAKRAPAPSLTFAIPAAVLVSYHLLTHDMAVLLLPIVLVMNQYIHRETPGDSSQWALWSALLLFAASTAQVFVSKHAFALLIVPILLFLAFLPANDTSLKDGAMVQPT
jgi:hypothetical protein